MLCQLSYTAQGWGDGWTRTSDPWFPKDPLPTHRARPYASPPENRMTGL